MSSRERWHTIRTAEFDMRKTLKRIIVPLALFALISLAVVVANQTAQLIGLADRVSPLAGDIAFWTILALYAFCLIVPVFMLLTLPAPLVPPAEREGPHFDAHLRKLGKRLQRNPHIEGAPVTAEEIETALTRLDGVADARTRASASQVFITTAISQNGSLDALLVLAAQSKLVLEIARVYYQRPTLRDLLYLYTNVAGTAFVAAELEDLDLSEQVQPVLTAILGSTAGAIPGLAPAATLFVNSVTTGAGNAFLTLRVGIITKQYCRSLVQPEQRSIRRMASLQATRMLGSIAKDGAATVAAAIWSRPRQYFKDLVDEANWAVNAAGEKVKEKGASAWRAVSGKRRVDDPDLEET
jgi:hypothetical protein